MARIHKVVAYIVDPNEEFKAEDIETVLQYHFSCDDTRIKSSEKFVWDDNLLINKVNCPIEEYEKYLNQNEGTN